MALPSPSRIRLYASIAIAVILLLMGWCHQCAPVVPPSAPAPPPAQPAAPPAAPAPPPAPAAVPAPPPAPVAVEVALDPSPAPVPAPAMPPEPVTAPLVEPAAPVQAPADPAAARRAEIRALLVKEGYRYGGKAPGPWPPQMLEEEIERRLRQ